MPDSYGIKIARPGYDVNTADDEHLILKSGFTLLKAKAYGALAFDGSQYLEVVHGLGYIPQYLAFGLEGDNLWPAVTQTPLFDFTGIIAVMDSDKLKLYGNGATDAAYYFIFIEETS